MHQPLAFIWNAGIPMGRNKGSLSLFLYIPLRENNDSQNQRGKFYPFFPVCPAPEHYGAIQPQGYTWLLGKWGEDAKCHLLFSGRS